MSTTVRTQGMEPRLRERSLERVLVVVAAVLAALAVWVVARFGLGVDVVASESSGPASQVGTANIAGVTATASLAGWTLLAGLEHVTAHAARWWLIIALVVAVVSLVGPITTPGFTPAGRVVLGLLHVVVGAVVIPLLRRCSTRQGHSR